MTLFSFFMYFLLVFCAFLFSSSFRSRLFFFFNDTATTEIYTYGHPLSRPDALPSSHRRAAPGPPPRSAAPSRGSPARAAAPASLRPAIGHAHEIVDHAIGQPLEAQRHRRRQQPALRLEVQGQGDLAGRFVQRVEPPVPFQALERARSEEHTSELQSLMRISYAVFCLKK